MSKLCLVTCVVALATGLAAFPTIAGAAPAPVTAWYMYGVSSTDLQSAAYTHGCAFAKAQPDTGTRMLLLDFGAARKLDSSTWGAVDFSNTTFSNPDILAALKRAADGYHNCHARGGVDIVYGTTNYHLSGSGMSATDTWYAGYHQADRAENLSDYQASKGYSSQTADAAGDLEPSWDSPAVTKQLVTGDQAQGWALYYDYGSADGCPQSGSSDAACNNGWHVSDVGYVSYHGLALPLPEIYSTASASQWTVVRKWWNATQSGSYFFEGATASTGVGLTPGASWNTLNSLNSGLVKSELLCFGC
jgi:hypothetical protein